MKILHLTLHKEWFDLIATSKKRIEFRKRKPYWTKRLAGKIFDEIWFKNGYAKNAPFMRVEWKGMSTESCEYYIRLGKVLEIRNYKLKDK